MSKDQDMPTRKMILTLIKTKGSLSVADLANALEITEMAVRRHIHTLERDRFIKSTLVRQPMGRPTHLYSLTPLADEIFPRNYQKLTLDLLEELSQEAGEDTVNQLFKGRQRKLQGIYESKMEGKNLQQRVSELASIQNEGGYMAEWEKDADGNFVLKEFNCPIAQVANHYDQACHCELSLFKELLETNVERTECLAKGGNKCVYLIQNKE